MTLSFGIDSAAFLRWYSEASGIILDRVCCCSYLDAQVCGETEKDAQTYFRSRSTTVPTEGLFEEDGGEEGFLEDVPLVDEESSQGVRGRQGRTNIELPWKKRYFRPNPFTGKASSPSPIKGSRSFETATTVTLKTVGSDDSACSSKKSRREDNSSRTTGSHNNLRHNSHHHHNSRDLHNQDILSDFRFGVPPHNFQVLKNNSESYGVSSCRDDGMMLQGGCFGADHRKWHCSPQRNSNDKENRRGNPAKTNRRPHQFSRRPTSNLGCYGNYIVRQVQQEGLASLSDLEGAPVLVDSPRYSC